MRRPISMVVLLLFAFVAFASAQDLIVDVNLRMIDVFVEDQNGNTVFDLTAEDFEVIENGRLMPLGHFSHESEPITIGLVVDRSSSIGPVRKKMDKAVTQLLQTVRPDDELLLMTLASGLNLDKMARQQDMLNPMPKTKLEFGTRFYDSFIDAVHTLSKGRFGRKALIIFSDGADHYSAHTFDQAAAAALLYGYPIFIAAYVGDDSLTWTAQGRSKIRNELEQLAALTGGRIYLPSPATGCPEQLPQILDTFHFPYKLGYYSTDRVSDSSNVKVRLRDKRFKGYRLRIASAVARGV